MKLKRSKCTAIIKNVLAPHFVEDLRANIGNSKFSVIIDESNDISTTKLMGIVIRYFSVTKKQVVVNFLDMVELNECNAD